MAKKRFGLKPLLIGLGAMIISLIPVAIADWAFGNSFSITPVGADVCYIKGNGDTKFYFPTVESAVAAANSNSESDSIYIIPGTKGSPRNVTIYNNIEISNGDALILPYQNETFMSTSDEYEAKSVTDFVKSASYSTLNVNLADGCTITINGGTLIVGGFTGTKGSSDMVSFTSDLHTVLTLGIGSSIISNTESTYTISNAETTLKYSVLCLGYIRRTQNDFSSSIIMNYGNIGTPVVVYDMKGGTMTSMIILSHNYFFPFSCFDFPNLEIKVSIKTNSNLIGLFRISTTGGTKEIYLIGKQGGSSLFQIGSNSQVDVSYSPKVYATPTKVHAEAQGVVQIELYGTITLVSIKINVGREIDSANYYLPIGYRFHIALKAGSNLNITKKVKFMNGSYFSSEPNSTININSQVIGFTKDYSSYTGGSYPYPFSTYTSPAEIYINGTANINGAIAGLIQTNTVGAVLNFNSAIQTLTSTEYQDFANSYTPKYADIREVPQGYINGTTNLTTFTKRSFTSKKDSTNNKYYWYFEQETNDFDLAIINSAGSNNISSSVTEVTLTASVTNISPSNVTAAQFSYQWLSSSDGTSYSNINGQNSATYTATTTAGSSVKTYYFKVVATHPLDQSISKEETITITQEKKGSGTCFLPTTEVLLSNGQIKQAKDLAKGDKLLTFDHITGQFVEREILFNVYVDRQLQDIITLTFDNGNTIKLATGHGFFNVDRNTYEIYYGNEFYDHIGETFLAVDYHSGNPLLEKTKLIDVEIRKEYTEKYSPLSEYDINCVAGGMLTIPDDIEGMLDSFTYKEDFTYDLEVLQADIDKYGVYSYEDVKDVVHPYVFDKFNFKYWKIFIKKGTLSYDKVNHWISTYMDQIVAWNNLDWDISKQVPLGPQHG